MAGQLLTVEFKEQLIRTYFLNEPAPDNLFMGLSSLELSDGDSPSLMELESAEPDENVMSYNRFRLLAPRWELATTLTEVEAKQESPAFANVSEVRWPALFTAFVSTINSKGGILVFWTPLRFTPRILAPGDVLEVPVTLVY